MKNRKDPNLIVRDQTPASLVSIINYQSAIKLLAATLDFLASNNVSEKAVADYVVSQSRGLSKTRNDRLYRDLITAYENMGLLMATWYSDPRFLNERGSPISLHAGTGKGSLTELIRATRVRLKASIALELMRRSPSIKKYATGEFVPLRRVFVLPGFELPRAALFVTRYLDTLKKNAAGRDKETLLLLERSCRVPEVDLNAALPMLRDIKGRGSAFMDSIDGDIEDRRSRGSKREGVGELGVLVFAWTRAKCPIP